MCFTNKKVTILHQTSICKIEKCVRYVILGTFPLYIYIYIYIYKQTYINIYTHIYIYTHIHTHTRIYIHIYIYIYIYNTYIYTYVYIHTHIHTYMHTYIHTHIYTYIYIYIYTYIHTYTHTYIYTYTNTYHCIRLYTNTCIILRAHRFIILILLLFMRCKKDPSHNRYLLYVHISCIYSLCFDIMRCTYVVCMFLHFRTIKVNMGSAKPRTAICHLHIPYNFNIC